MRSESTRGTIFPPTALRTACLPPPCKRAGRFWVDDWMTPSELAPLQSRSHSPRSARKA